MVTANGMQIGTAQHVFKMHTDVLEAHCLLLVQASKSEQITCGPQIDRFIDVSKRKQGGGCEQLELPFSLLLVALIRSHIATEQPEEYLNVGAKDTQMFGRGNRDVRVLTAMNGADP